MNEFLTIGINKNSYIDENLIKLLEKDRGIPLTEEGKEAARNLDPFTRFILLPLFMEDD